MSFYAVSDLNGHFDFHDLKQGDVVVRMLPVELGSVELLEDDGFGGYETEFSTVLFRISVGADVGAIDLGSLGVESERSYSRTSIADLTWYPLVVVPFESWGRSASHERGRFMKRASTGGVWMYWRREHQARSSVLAGEGYFSAFAVPGKPYRIGVLVREGLIGLVEGQLPSGSLTRRAKAHLSSIAFGEVEFSPSSQQGPSRRVVVYREGGGVVLDRIFGGSSDGDTTPVESDVSELSAGSLKGKVNFLAPVGDYMAVYFSESLGGPEGANSEIDIARFSVVENQVSCVPIPTMRYGGVVISLPPGVGFSQCMTSAIPTWNEWCLRGPDFAWEARRLGWFCPELERIESGSQFVGLLPGERCLQYVNLIVDETFSVSAVLPRGRGQRCHAVSYLEASGPHVVVKGTSGSQRFSFNLSSGPHRISLVDPLGGVWVSDVAVQPGEESLAEFVLQH